MRIARIAISWLELFGEPFPFPPPPLSAPPSCPRLHSLFLLLALLFSSWFCVSSAHSCFSRLHPPKPPRFHSLFSSRFSFLLLAPPPGSPPVLLPLVFLFLTVLQTDASSSSCSGPFRCHQSVHLVTASCSFLFLLGADQLVYYSNIVTYFHNACFLSFQ
jgi:hypothetical protein